MIPPSISISLEGEEKKVDTETIEIKEIQENAPGEFCIGIIYNWTIH